MDEDRLASLVIRHAIAAEGYSKTIADKIVRLLNSADADLVEKIAGRYAMMEANGFDRGPATTKRFEDMLDAIRAINAQVYEKISNRITDDLVAVAGNEAEFIAKAANASGAKLDLGTTIPDARFLQTLVETTPIAIDANGAALLKPWVEGMEAGRFRRLEGALRLGIFTGESTDQIVTRIRGTNGNGYQDGLLNVSRQSAQSFVLTANSSVQNAARTETYKAMKSIAYVEFSAVLDSRTSPICQSLSGRIYALDEPHPIPPRHIRCRSILLPRRNNTDPPKHKPFSTWIAEQSEKVQDKVLGPTKAGLLRSGKLSASDLYRNDGSFKTIDELRKFDAEMLDE